MQCFVDYISTNAGATMVLVAVTVVYVVLVGLSIGHLKRQGKAAKEQCDLMREQMDRIREQETKEMSVTALAIQGELTANLNILFGSLLLDVAFDALTARLGSLPIGERTFVAISKAYALIKRHNVSYSVEKAPAGAHTWWDHAQQAVGEATNALARDEEWLKLVKPAMAARTSE